MTGQPAAPLPTLDYPALRLRWCRLALHALVRRWGVYGLVLMAVVGAGSNSPLDSVGAVAAWLVLPLFQAAARPGWAAWWLLPVVAAQSLLAGGVVWAMRPLLWPAPWAAAERALPIPPALQRRSDLTVVAWALLPLLLLYGLGAATWLAHHPAWLMPWRGRALLGLVLLGLGSLGLGLGMLQWWRRPPARHPAHPVQPPPAALGRPGSTAAGRSWAAPGRVAGGSVSACGLLWLLWLAPLWRGPARRTGQALLLGSALLLGLALGVHLAPPALAGWWLAAFALAGLLVSTRVNTLSRREFAALLAACTPLPLASTTLQRQRVSLAMLPLLLGVLLLAGLLPWGQARPLVAVAYLLANAALALVELCSSPADASAKASRWLVTLVVLLALASEVMV